MTGSKVKQSIEWSPFIILPTHVESHWARNTVWMITFLNLQSCAETSKIPIVTVMNAELFPVPVCFRKNRSGILLVNKYDPVFSLDLQLNALECLRNVFTG
jgi:hypothetical protein